MKIATATAALSLLAFSGCGAIVKSKVAEHGDVGWPYYLPRTVLKITVTVAKPPSQSENTHYSLSLGVTPQLVADPTHELVLSHTACSLSSDLVDVKFTASGLLQYVGADSEDKSLEAVSDLVKAALEVAKLPVAFPVGLLPDLNARLEPLVGTHETYVPLPDLLPEQKTVRIDLPSPGSPFTTDPDWSLQVSISPVSPAGRPKLSDYSYRADGESQRGIQPNTSYGGVLVRGLDPFLVMAQLSCEGSFKQPPASSHPDRSLIAARAGLTPDPQTSEFILKNLTQIRLVEVPDYAPVFTIPLYRTAFVKATHAVTFKDGMLTGVNKSRPSLVGAVAKFPYEVVKAIVALPAEIIQLKIDTTSKEAELLALEQAKSASSTAELAAEADFQEAYAQAVAAQKAYEADPTKPELRAAFIQAAALANKKAVLARRSIPFPPELFPNQP